MAIMSVMKARSYVAGEQVQVKPAVVKQIREAQQNKLAILTTILPYMEEEDRIIFGLFFDR